MDPTNILADNVRRMRLTAGLTQDELAARTKGQISQTYLSDIERGLADNITLGKLHILATALNTTIPVLLTSYPQNRKSSSEAA